MEAAASRVMTRRNSELGRAKTLYFTDKEAAEAWAHAADASLALVQLREGWNFVVKGVAAEAVLAASEQEAKEEQSKAEKDALAAAGGKAKDGKGPNPASESKGPKAPGGGAAAPPAADDDGKRTNNVAPIAAPVDHVTTGNFSDANYHDSDEKVPLLSHLRHEIVAIRKQMKQIADENKQLSAACTKLATENRKLVTTVEQMDTKMKALTKETRDAKAAADRQLSNEIKAIRGETQRLDSAMTTLKGLCNSCIDMQTRAQQLRNEPPRAHHRKDGSAAAGHADDDRKASGRGQVHPERNNMVPDTEREPRVAQRCTTCGKQHRGECWHLHGLKTQQQRSTSRSYADVAAGKDQKSQRSVVRVPVNGRVEVEEDEKKQRMHMSSDDAKCSKCSRAHEEDKCPAVKGCFACGEVNHYGSQCRAPPKKRMKWRTEIRRLKADGRYLHRGYLFQLRLHKHEQAEATDAVNGGHDDGNDHSRDRRGRKRRGSSRARPRQ